MNHGPQEVFDSNGELEKRTTVKVKLESTCLPVLQCPFNDCCFTTHIEGTLRKHVLDHMLHQGKKQITLRIYNCPKCNYFTTIQSLINEHISLSHNDADSQGECEVIVRWERFQPDQSQCDTRVDGRLSPYPISAPIETCSSNSSPPPVVSLESQYSRQVSSPSPSQQDLAIPLPINERCGEGPVGGFNGDLISPPPPPPPPSFQQTPASSSTSSILNSIALPNPNRPTSPPMSKKGSSTNASGVGAENSIGGVTAGDSVVGSKTPVSTAASSGGLHGSRKRKRAIPARCQQLAPESNVQSVNDEVTNVTNWQSPTTTMLFMKQSNNSGSSPREVSSFDEMDSVVTATGNRTTEEINNKLKLGILTGLYSGNISSSIRAMFSNSNSTIDLNGFAAAAAASQDQALDMSVRDDRLEGMRSQLYARSIALTANGSTASIKDLAANAIDEKLSEAPLDTSSLLLTATSGSADIQKVLSRIPIAQLDPSVCVSVPCSPDPSEPSVPSPPPDSRSGSEPPTNPKGSSNSSGGNTGASTPATSKPHRQNFTQQQNDILNRWYQCHSEKPYPSTEQTKELANECILSYSQVKKWFANKRARTSKGNRSANGNLNSNGSTLGDAGSPMDCTPTVSFSRSMLDLAQVVPPSSTSSSPKMPPLAVSVDPLRSPGSTGVGPHINGGTSSSGGSGPSVLPERFPFMLSGTSASTAYQMQRLIQSSLASLSNPLSLSSATSGVSAMTDLKKDADRSAIMDVKKETDRSDGEEIDEEEADAK